MLEEISKMDKEWRLIALKICGDKSLSDDLVNDMYLKIHDLKKQQVNRHYISYCIYHLYLNYIKKQKETIDINNIHYSTIKDDEETTEERIKINDALNELHLFDREILLIRNEMSLREASQELNKFGNGKNISHRKIDYQSKNALKKLKETKTIKDWLNER